MTTPVSPSAPVAWGILNHGNNLFWPEIAPDREGAEGMLAALNEKQAGYGVVRSVEPLYASPAPSMVGLAEAVALLESRCAAIDRHYERFPNSLDRTMEDTAKAIRVCLALLAREGVAGIEPARKAWEA